MEISIIFSSFIGFLGGLLVHYIKEYKRFVTALRKSQIYLDGEHNQINEIYNGHKIKDKQTVYHHDFIVKHQEMFSEDIQIAFSGLNKNDELLKDFLTVLYGISSFYETLTIKNMHADSYLQSKQEEILLLYNTRKEEFYKDIYRTELLDKIKKLRAEIEAYDKQCSFCKFMHFLGWFN